MHLFELQSLFLAPRSLFGFFVASSRASCWLDLLLFSYLFSLHLILVRHLCACVYVWMFLALVRPARRNRTVRALRPRPVSLHALHQSHQAIRGHRGAPAAAGVSRSTLHDGGRRRRLRAPPVAFSLFCTPVPGEVGMTGLPTLGIFRCTRGCHSFITRYRAGKILSIGCCSMVGLEREGHPSPCSFLNNAKHTNPRPLRTTTTTTTAPHHRHHRYHHQDR